MDDPQILPQSPQFNTRIMDLREAPALRGLKVMVLTARESYPNGLAATQRIRLVARAMAEAGASVSIKVGGFHPAGSPLASEAEGVCDGIPFRHLRGRTQLRPTKLGRVCDRLAVAFRAARELSSARRTGQVDVLYYYTSVLELDWEHFLVGWTGWRTGVPIIIDLCEAPWPLSARCRALDRRVSPFWGVDGAIVISEFLAEWAREESRRIAREILMLQVPILVDLDERPPEFGAGGVQRVVFAGAPAYDQTIRFAAEAMAPVWDRYPGCELWITGTAPGTPEYSRLEERIQEIRPKGPVRLAGLLPRQSLLELYRRANALVIPLFADVRSIARFPTKIGEYLASGRPVVTSCVGEIPLFFRDGYNACVAMPGNPASFGARILRLIAEPDWASALGRKGWETARQHFHYSVHGARLLAFFEHVQALRKTRGRRRIRGEETV
jgi:glycosyltransferase involved in cell wall biosynthesis